MRDWVATVSETHYCLGSVMGPHPYPWMVREFQRIIGEEAHAQCRELLHGDDPDFVVACVGGGSNAMGIFSGFIGTTTARLIGVEPAGGAAVGRGVPGVVAVGPEHSYLASIGRAEYPTVTDDEVISAFQLMARAEGIIPALECAHAMAWIVREAPKMQGKVVLMNLSGRGDKDVGQMMEILG